MIRDLKKIIIKKEDKLKPKKTTKKGKTLELISDELNKQDNRFSLEDNPSV